MPSTTSTTAASSTETSSTLALSPPFTYLTSPRTLSTSPTTPTWHCHCWLWYASPFPTLDLPFFIPSQRESFPFSPRTTNPIAGSFGHVVPEAIGKPTAGHWPTSMIASPRIHRWNTGPLLSLRTAIISVAIPLFVPTPPTIAQKNANPKILESIMEPVSDQAKSFIQCLPFLNSLHRLASQEVWCDRWLTLITTADMPSHRVDIGALLPQAVEDDLITS